MVCMSNKLIGYDFMFISIVLYLFEFRGDGWELEFGLSVKI